MRKNTSIWHSEEDILSWPENHKRCRDCKKIKHIGDFHKGGKRLLLGVSTDCSECRNRKLRQKRKNSKPNIEIEMYRRAKQRARINNVPFTIKIEDIILPEFCPIFKKPFIYKDNDWTYSLDRIIPEKGYTLGNIIIVSNKANRIKNNGSADDIIVVGEFYKNIASYTTA